MLFDEQTPVASPLPVLEQDCLSDYRDSLNNNYNTHNYNNYNYNHNNSNYSNQQHLTIASAPSSYHSSFSSGASLSLEALLIEHGLLQPTAAAAATTSPQLHYLETGPQYNTFMSPGTTYRSVKSPSPMEQFTVVSQYTTAPRLLASSPTFAIAASAADASAAAAATEKSTRKSSKSTPMEEPGMDIVHHAIQTPINPNLRIQRRSSSSPSDEINTGSQTDAKPVRFHPTPCELQTLVGVFEVNPFPSRVLREKLAQHMGITMRQIQLWFQNRRAFKKAAGLTFTRPLKNTRRMSAKF
ncbi:hypothetical protein CcCBS67573_g07803 [Chytriomyces confervae]|uniref:Homeobox domain-containing protein n=1 Tax=Chytriomyces confervae TaxID=246404 RepID=A0A507ERP6_9FUNG|nr:hypothetical protein CcCBS67573_g07803 [Chytriomyces confervae]